jgi:ribosomal protein S18 acetylase RimI-like enzyme
MAKRRSFPLKIDEWDSRFFNTSIARLTISGKAKDLFLSEMLSDLMIRARGAKVRYLIVKLENSDGFHERILRRFSMKERGKSVDLKFSYDDRKKGAFFSEYDIHLLRSSDLGKIKDIASDAFRKSYFYRCGFAKRNAVDRYHARWVENLSKGKNTFIFTAKKDKEVAGFLILKLDKGERSARIILIAAHKKSRGRGVGRALMNRCIEWGEGRIKEIFVKTQQNNSAAVMLYKKIDFKPVGYDTIFCKNITFR